MPKREKNGWSSPYFAFNKALLASLNFSSLKGVPGRNCKSKNNKISMVNRVTMDQNIRRVIYLNIFGLLTLIEKWEPRKRFPLNH